MAVPYSTNYDTVPFSDVTANMALATGTALSFTVPGTSASRYSVRFSYTQNSNVFVGYNITATSPTAGTIASQNGIEFRPFEQRYAKGGDVLSFITPDASAYVGISLRMIPN